MTDGAELRKRGAPYPVSEPQGLAASIMTTEPAESHRKQGHERRPSSEGPETIFRMLKDVGMSLNLLPTLALCTPFFVFFLLLASFIEWYVLSSTAHFAIFLVGSYTVFSSYFVANCALQRAHLQRTRLLEWEHAPSARLTMVPSPLLLALAPTPLRVSHRLYERARVPACTDYMSKQSSSYAAIPDDKKFYVLSNLIKSAVLLAYCPLAARTLFLALVRGQWSTPRIRQLGVLYAIPDAVSMALVERMAWSTKVHHVCVVAFMVVNLFNTYEDETVGRALVVYAIFSTFAYLVNLLLASRFLPVAPRLSLAMAVTACIIYAGCLAINWTWQVAYLYRLATTNPTPGLLVYISAISLVVYDDCVLVK